VKSDLESLSREKKLSSSRESTELASFSSPINFVIVSRGMDQVAWSHLSGSNGVGLNDGAPCRSPTNINRESLNYRR
jgi:hypothetical protein